MQASEERDKDVATERKRRREERLQEEAKMAEMAAELEKMKKDNELREKMSQKKIEAIDQGHEEVQKMLEEEEGERPNLEYTTQGLGLDEEEGTEEDQVLNWVLKTRKKEPTKTSTVLKVPPGVARTFTLDTSDEEEEEREEEGADVTLMDFLPPPALPRKDVKKDHIPGTLEALMAAQTAELFKKRAERRENQQKERRRRQKRRQKRWRQRIASWSS